MPSRAASTASVRHVWRRFRRNGRGSAAVEFALVAPVFFALLFAIIDTGVMFFASQQPRGPGDIVVVRLFYQWPLYVTGLGYNIANLSGSKRLLAATAAFCNEPY